MALDLNENDIPEVLQAPSKAALKWLNDTHHTEFELTGVVDYEVAIEQGLSQPFEIGLVLCDGEICKREQVQITPEDHGYTIRLGPAVEREIPSLLDPPPGVRSSWLERQLEKYDFVVLLFYRGLW